MTEQAGVGAELAQARAALGLSVADVAQQLKFSTRQIEALEADRFQELPAGTFARGMLRAYARLVKLDAEVLVARISERVAAPDNTAAVASVHRAIPITDSARRTNLIYAACSVGLLVVIAAVVIEWQQERSKAARLTFVPAAQAPQESKGTEVASAAAATPLAPPSMAPVAEAAPAQVAAVAEVKAAPGPAYVSSAKPAAGNKRLVLKFERESWVEVRGRGGKLLLQQLNAAGSERAVDGEAPFQLIIGNAQHVRVSYDDRPVDLSPHVKVEVARFTLE